MTLFSYIILRRHYSSNIIIYFLLCHYFLHLIIHQALLFLLGRYFSHDIIFSHMSLTIHKLSGIFTHHCLLYVIISSHVIIFYVLFLIKDFRVYVYTSYTNPYSISFTILFFMILYTYVIISYASLFFLHNVSSILFYLYVIISSLILFSIRYYFSYFIIFRKILFFLQYYYLHNTIFSASIIIILNIH